MAEGPASYRCRRLVYLGHSEDNRTMNGSITVGLLRVIHILGAAMAVARYVP